MNKYYYSYNEFQTDAQQLIHKAKTFNPEALLAIARGGLTLGHFMAQGLNNRNLFTINSIHYEEDIKLNSIKVFNIPSLKKYSKILIVDDIVDSGETMVEILKILHEDYPNIEFKTASLFYKKSALIKPDYSIKEAVEWIDFFWEVDSLD